MASQKRPLVFGCTVVVMDDATLQLLFAHRLISAAYSKRPPATNSRKRKILTVRRQRPDLRVLLPAEEAVHEQGDGSGAVRSDGDGDGDGDDDGDGADGTGEQAASKRAKVTEAPRSWAETGAPDVRTVVHEATGNVEDRRTKSDMYEAIVCLPLRLTPEEVYCAVTHGLVHLTKTKDTLWVARVVAKDGEEDNNEEKEKEKEEGNKETDAFAGCAIGASAFERRSCLVYEDLWKKGWIITKGTNFGAEFLIYTSDPGTTHSIFMISVTDGEREHETALSVKWTALSALATKVRKRMLLATVDAANAVRYTLVEGCLFRRTDFLKGKAMENEALQQEPQYVEPAALPTVRDMCDSSRAAAGDNEHDELGVESSIAV